MRQLSVERLVGASWRERGIEAGKIFVLRAPRTTVPYTYAYIRRRIPHPLTPFPVPTAAEPCSVLRVHAGTKVFSDLISACPLWTAGSPTSKNITVLRTTIRSSSHFDAAVSAVAALLPFGVISSQSSTLAFVTIKPA